MKSGSFEKELEKSREILEKLMDPEITLENSLKLYEEGIESIRKAQKMIDEARLRIKEIEEEQQEETG
jgi:exodeoxyribonuclease VII small subunit